MHDGSGFQFVDWTTVRDHMAPDAAQDDVDEAFAAEKERVVETVKKKFAIYFRCEPEEIEVEFAGAPTDHVVIPVEHKLTNFSKSSPHDDAAVAAAQASMQATERR
jgi:hypothetical protein